ncbi:hypothetical protein [Microbacterium sp.]|uniref:hypothetical protein n=1 Tax=Microbacterium sp. TaxID=51671 RepID=UPI002FE3AFA0
MSAVSTANATVAPGLAALFGGAPDGGGLGSAAGGPSSFGAALAVAERMLDAGDLTMPSDAEAVAPSGVAAPAGGPDVQVSVDAAGGGSAAPDAGLSAAIAVLAVPPIAPPAQPEPQLGVAQDTITDDTQAASGPRPAQAADEPQVMDADASLIPVASAGAANVRASDPRPVIAPGSIAATPPIVATAGAAPDAPVARAEPMPAPGRSPSATVGSDEPGVIPAATSAPKDGSARPDQPAPQSPVPSASPPALSVSPPGAPVVTAADAAAAVPRAVAAQVAPVVLSIVQRPVGSHQLTMTVNPDTLGPVTVRAHISAGGEVRVELLGATDAGREALRTIVTDLRRDLAAVMPHASLALGSSAAATDAGSPDRGAQPGSGGPAGEQAPGERGRAAADGHPTAERRAGGIPGILPITTRAVSGEGLDIFA